MSPASSDGERLLDQALRLASQGADAERWRRITVLAAGLSPAQVDALDQALRDWPDAIRLAARDWGVPLPPLTSQTYCPPALRIARRLEIRHDRLTAENLEALASCEHLSQLRALLLFDNGLDLAAIAALCRSPSLGALRALTIGGNYVDDDGAKLIAEARAFRRSKSWPCRRTG